MTKSDFIKTGVTENFEKNIAEAVKSILTDLPVDVTIISGENEEIQTNKYILSLFSPSLSGLLFSSCCTSPTLFLPDWSTSSINSIINIINNGFVKSSEHLSEKNEIIEIGNMLFVDMILDDQDDEINQRNKALPKKNFMDEVMYSLNKIVMDKTQCNQENDLTQKAVTEDNSDPKKFPIQGMKRKMISEMIMIEFCFLLTMQPSNNK